MHCRWYIFSPAPLSAFCCGILEKFLLLQLLFSFFFFRFGCTLTIAGVLLNILACALWGNWWPFMVGASLKLVFFPLLSFYFSFFPSIIRLF
jgi:hypothetical protein